MRSQQRDACEIEFIQLREPKRIKKVTNKDFIQILEDKLQRYQKLVAIQRSELPEAELTPAKVNSEQEKFNLLLDIERDNVKELKNKVRKFENKIWGIRK
jgi:hypothetical protein